MPHQFFHYEVGDPVTIVPIGEPGHVTACMRSIEGVEYEVAYWFEGKRQKEFLRAYDLEAR